MSFPSIRHYKRIWLKVLRLAVCITPTFLANQILILFFYFIISVLGSSINPSSNTYAGPGPFSEIETRTLSQYIAELAPNMDMYLSFHSSGQLLLIPYGNTTQPLDNYYDAVNISDLFSICNLYLFEFPPIRHSI